MQDETRPKVTRRTGTGQPEYVRPEEDEGALEYEGNYPSRGYRPKMIEEDGTEFEPADG